MERQLPIGLPATVAIDTASGQRALARVTTDELTQLPDDETHAQPRQRGCHDLGYHTTTPPIMR
ncbi:hypothetical protein [Frigoribacterium sp. PhB24]|uniref:hypothetical protein n=1 Tax=Frigoribacterium sp. PhB24 TaxID=2485204 RepID=UPI000F4841E8|nr:hypothetical protein [Frigoribacterium sp. PhB24]ROS52698.1 hypothetical protein EDF50_1163 [Frigoribacterium sp. PhB24]